MQTKTRLAGPDILRGIAILLVMTIHSINYSGELGENLQSLRWTAFAALYQLTKICVPLFMLLTGYLQSQHTLSRKHYTSIIPVLISYAVLILPVLIGNFIRGESALRQILYIFDFEAGYSWYVEMYICLFLLIPFLNVLYHALTRPQKKLLLGILVTLTMLPGVFESFVVAGAVLSPVPDFLESLYIVAYYYIGAYIAEYRPAPKPLACLGAAAAMLLAETALYFALAHSPERWRFLNSYASLPHAFIATCLFLALYRREAIKNRAIGWLVREISVCSFEMYLISCFMDALVYNYLPAPWAMPIVFTLSFLLAKLLRLGLVPLSRRLRQKAEMIKEKVH